LSFHSLIQGSEFIYRTSTDNHHKVNKFLFPPDSTLNKDTTKVVLPYSPEEEVFPYTGNENTNPLFLKPPSGLKSDVKYDPATGLYILEHKIGNVEYRPPTYMSLEEYREYDLKNSVKDYWKERSKSAGGAGQTGIIPSLYIGGKVFDRVFGGHTIEIIPSGDVILTFQVKSNTRDDPTIDIKQRSQTNFDFDEEIRMNVRAKIGDKIEFNTNYNTKATFDFENKLKLSYQGDEDEILQLLEAGDVSLPLNSTLITGSQSLFGIKSKLRFGRTTVTALYSEQESQTSSISVQGGAQTNEFLIKIDEYEENKHFFLAQFFRNNYDSALKDLPIINSSINITKIEVWVTNIGAAVTENRNLIAFTDIGEHDSIFNKTLIQPLGFGPLPRNNANTLFQKISDTAKVRDINLANYYLLGLGFTPSEDFEKIQLARKLSPNEFSLNNKLGFISLNSGLNSDQTLAVAFQYQVIGSDSTYQVGEFSDEGITGASALIVKLLKSTYVNIRSPLWDLMMKNVYSLNAYQVNRDDFTLNILYSGDQTGVPTGYFADGPFKGIPLIRVFNLDNLDAQMKPISDGLFDFIDNASTQGGTINSMNGRIFFTVVEPFGGYLRHKLDGYPELQDKYCYDSLYTLTKTGAQQFTEKNKFLISGFYKSQAGSEISLNALNIPQGSVIVTAGGVTLKENVDYTVDYTLGRVRIINEGILNSGTPINISMESNTMFSVQTKRLMGAHIDYDFNKNFHIGGTVLNLHERPLTQKVNYGDDPISNTIWGLDYRYQTESRFITRLVDKLPFISTSAPSSVSVEGEFAHFIPGHSRAVGSEGVSYIDDFEGTKSTIDLRSYGASWSLGSTPQFQADLFPESSYNDSTNRIYNGFNRAKMAWFIIDPSVFYDRNGNLKPDNISDDELSNHFVRQVLEQELYPKKELANGTPTNIGVFNIAYYPSEKGPYNYDVEPVDGVSAGISPEGTLNDPASRWGGIMREIETPDFEASNIEYIEFWMMDPFAEGSINTNHTGGDLYIDLGDVSEDILKDSRKSFEHGLPTSGTFEEQDIARTVWGRVPNKLDLVQSFSNEAGSRDYQDVGLDGLRDEVERSYFTSNSEYAGAYNYLDRLKEPPYGENSQAYQNAFADPSNDNFHSYRGGDYDSDPSYSSVLKRYKQYNGPDGNSPENDNGGIYEGNTREPDAEDLNKDNTLSEGERYFQYKIILTPNSMKVGENFIADIREANGIQLANQTVGSVKWYQFKIPVREATKVVGNIYDFKSIRFMRMFLKGFSEPVVLRFATLDLVRGEWRRYPSSSDLLEPDVYLTTSQINAKSFELSAVNLEENSEREPIKYFVPPGIEREINIGTTNLTQLNEQAMVVKVCDLADGDAVGAYKTADFDFRQFKRLKMYVHAEKSKENDVLKYGDLTVFIRLGSDFTQNYYEYEIPLTPTQWNDPENAEAVWPEANNIDIELEKLAQLKLERNTAMRQPGSTVELYYPYYGFDGNSRMTVYGSPSISDVKAIMIGVRNPRKTSADLEDDGETKCAEIWVNELRLSDFNKQTGWATTARVSTNLADLGNLVVSGMYKSPWFASLDQKLTQIQLDGHTQFDIATNLELGKFFPEKTGIKIPMHFDYSEARIRPKFNPLDPDLQLNDVIDSYDIAEEKDSIKSLTIDYTQRKNINFMNVRKDKVGEQKKSHIYDISNFSASYSYSEIYHRNIDIENELKQNYMGGLGYNYAGSPKNIKPFEKNTFISESKTLQLIKDFNFYFLPKMFSFRTDMNREYQTRKLRNKSYGDIPTFPSFNKTWEWNRIYDFKFDLTQALSFTFNANAGSFINEFPGSNKELWRESESGDANGDGILEDITPDQKKQKVWDEIGRGGTKKRYAQTAGLTYNIPITKLPLLDWVTSTAGYNVSYNWTASPVSLQKEFGNTIQNNVNWNINGNADFSKLYNKVGFLKKILTPAKKQPAKKGVKKDAGKSEDSTNVVKPKVNFGKIGFETAMRLLTSVKKITFQYSENKGTTMPGFVPEPDLLGNTWGMNAPGLKFIYGYQPGSPDYFNQENWLSKDQRLNTAFAQTANKTLNLRITLEPLKDFKIDVSFDRTQSNQVQSYFVFNDSIDAFVESSRREMGSFTMSYITWGTAFGGDLDNDQSLYFENFKKYRIDVAARIKADDPRDLALNDSTGFPSGYGPSSQYVLMPAFLAAYSGQNPDNISLKTFPDFPLPYWKISYSGLSKIPFLQKIFKSVTLNHSYHSTYSIGSYTSSINFQDTIVDGRSLPNARNINSGDFYPELEFANVTITEQFNPLINVDVTFLNSLLAKFEINKSRNLSLSFSNNQLTELKSEEYVIGSGFRFKEVPISFSRISGGTGKTFKSDVNVKADFSIKKDITVLRSIDTDLNQVSRGEKVTGINFSIDYDLSKSLSLELFFKKTTNKPFVSSNYRRSETFGGIKLRFSLAQ
jgi:cell surface protein SprA